MNWFFWFKATTVVDQELLESNIPVEEVDEEGHQAAASDFGGWRSVMDEMDEGYNEYLDVDPRPPDQHTPPNTPPPQVEGGGSCRGGHGHCIQSESVRAQDIATAAAVAAAAFEVGTQQSTVRAQKTKRQYYTVFFRSLFKFFSSPSSNTLPFVLLI